MRDCHNPQAIRLKSVKQAARKPAHLETAKSKLLDPAALWVCANLVTRRIHFSDELIPKEGTATLIEDSSVNQLTCGEPMIDDALHSLFGVRLRKPSPQRSPLLCLHESPSRDLQAQLPKVV